MREAPIISKPDNLFIGLVFDLQSKLHVKTIIGHYSEYLPYVDLLSKHWMSQLYFNNNGSFIVLLHNCVRKRSDFKAVINHCFYQLGLHIDLFTVFNQVERLLWIYRQTDGIGKPVYPVSPRIKNDAIKAIHDLSYRRREFNLLNVSTPNIVAPMEFGSYLRNVNPVHLP